jgi:hypothetical protein
MSEKTKLVPITILPSVLKIGKTKSEKLFNTNRGFSKYVTYLINKDNDR